MTQTLAQESDSVYFQSLYDSAKKHHSLEEGKPALEKKDNAWIAKSYLLIVYYQEKNERYYEALKNYFAALEYYEKAENVERQVATFTNVALVYELPS